MEDPIGKLRFPSREAILTVSTQQFYRGQVLESLIHIATEPQIGSRRGFFQPSADKLGDDVAFLQWSARTA